MSLCGAADAGEEPGVAHAAQPLVPRPSHPDALFVPRADGALKVDAPPLAGGIEVERAERNRDLEGPSDLAAGGARVPDAVPFPVLAVDPEQRVSHETRRVHLEEVARASVEERVDR